MPTRTLIVAFCITTLAILLLYFIWLFTPPSIINDASFFYTNIDSIYSTDSLEKIEAIKTGRNNFKPNYFFLKKGFKPYHPYYNPFCNISVQDTIIFNFFIGKTIGNQAYQETIILHNLEFEVNNILSSLQVGYQVKFDKNIHIYDDSSSIDLAKISKHTTNINLYLKKKGLDFSVANNLIIVSKNIKFQGLDSFAFTSRNFLGKQFIFFELNSQLFSPVLFVHEFLHCTTSNCYKDLEEMSKCNQHIMVKNIKSKCKNHIYTKDLLHFSKGIEFDTLVKKSIWPVDKKNRCCPETKEKDFTIAKSEIFFVLHPSLLTNLSNQDDIKSLMPQFNAIQEGHVFNTLKYSEAVEIESEIFGFEVSKEYIQRCWIADMDIIRRNAKIILNHFMVNKKKEIPLRKADYKDVLKEFYCEKLISAPDKNSLIYLYPYMNAYKDDLYFKISFKQSDEEKHKKEKLKDGKIILTNGHYIKLERDSLYPYINNIRKKALNINIIDLDTINIKETIKLPCANTKYCFTINNTNNVLITVLNNNNMRAYKFATKYCFNSLPNNLYINYNIGDEKRTKPINGIVESNFGLNSGCIKNYRSRIDLN
ncbi:MAG: hypothetical protein KA270_01730 [Saprospiraceae bacterium]|nr:hypothetical protein [Saprospiraceae bacterium]MBP6565853.1 hypothetical protein [Saprospiraceae bacterium]